MFGYSCMRVKGDSMAPTLKNGDFVIIRTSSSNHRLSKNDIVVMKKLCEPMLIKRVVGRVEDTTYQLAGDGVGSMPKIDLTNVSISQIIGKAVFAINKLGIKKL